MFTDEQIQQLEGLFSRQRVAIQKDFQDLETRLRQDINQEIHREIQSSEDRVLSKMSIEIKASEDRIMGQVKLQIKASEKRIMKNVEFEMQTFEKRILSSIQLSEERVLSKLYGEIQASEKRVLSKLHTEIQDVSSIINKLVETTEDHRVRIQALEEEVGISSSDLTRTKN